jgi:hypothetical protein
MLNNLNSSSNFIIVSPCIFHNSLFIKHRRNALHFTTFYFTRPLHMFRFMHKPSSGGFQNYIYLHPMVFLSLLLCNILVCNCHSLLQHFTILHFTFSTRILTNSQRFYIWCVYIRFLNNSDFKLILYVNGN